MIEFDDWLAKEHEDGVSVDQRSCLLSAWIAGKESKSADWQPIETAPKDHFTDVLLWGVDLGVTIGFWSDGWARIDGLDVDPTHWMPLPAPPAQEGEG
jgi:hypothetical protein